MSPTSSAIKQLSHQLGVYLFECHMVPMSYLHTHRARREFKLIKSIQHRLKNSNQILRVTDKSGIFHLGDAKDYEQKVQEHQRKMGAYVELESNPLWTVFDKVVHLLNDLRSKKHIFAWQLQKMMPKQETVELGHLYFIPKPHKLHFAPFFLFVHLMLSSLVLGGHTTETNRVFDAHTYHGHIQVSRSTPSTIVR